jgi:hypothetical protein
MPQYERQREIKRRRQRQLKVRALKSRLETERDAKVRAKLIAKLKKISPLSPAPEK